MKRIIGNLLALFLLLLVAVGCEDSQSNSLGYYAFSNSNFVNIGIPSNVSSITG